MTDFDKLNENVEMIAAICHTVNKAYCEQLGDMTQVKWKLAPDWQRESAMAGVRAHLADETLTGEQSHRLWCEAKEKDGWVYGPVKDADKKTHPCLTPYSSLPFEQRVKDHLFKAVVEGVRQGLWVDGT